MSVAFNPVGNVYVADLGNHRIQKFSSDGTYLCQWDHMAAVTGSLHI